MARSSPAVEPPWALFPRRLRTPREARRPLPLAPVADPQGALEEALAQAEPRGERVAYVHLPFCASACSFCGYQREVGASPQVIEGYLAALGRQLAVFAARPWTRARPFAALHLGGGTPTLLPPDRLVGLLGELTAALPLAPGAEITVESTISGLDPASLSALRAAGATRLALGVQTFDSGLRRSLGRHASGEEALARIAQARDAGFDDVCVDLLYGLPDQTLATWEGDLAAVAASGATGASIYPLVPSPASALGRRLAALHRSAFLDLEAEYALFLAADRALAGRLGWTRLTPVQYGDARLGGAAYITACGRGAEVLALGAGAAGGVGALAYLNGPGTDDFVRGWSSGGRWPLTAARGGKAQALARPLWQLGETTRLEAAHRAEAPAPLATLLARLVGLGLAEEGVAGSLALTTAGCFWAANVCELISIALNDLDL